MNTIKIKVRKLGRVKDSELSVAPFMVFSGESGLGKSYLALLCHYFFELMVNLTRLNHFFIDRSIDFVELSKSYKNTGTALTIRKKELEEWMAQDAIHYLSYMLGHDKLNGEIVVELPSSVPDKLIYTYREEYTGLVGAEDVDLILSLGNLSYRIKNNTQFEETPFSILLRYMLVEYVFDDWKKLNMSFVFPPSRGPVLTESIIPSTGMYIEFLRDLTTLNRPNQRPFENSIILSELVSKILEGEVSRKENTYLYKTGDVSMPISAAAASIKEIAPLQLFIKKEDVSKSAVLLEEPEAHLHPLKQRMMADIIGTLVHEGTVMQITTHSDYFLRRLNELILFGSIYAKAGVGDVIDEISNKTGIVESMTIKPDDLAAYFLEKQTDGSSKAIRQKLNDGVPYSAFREAILDNLNNQDVLGGAFEDVTEG